MNTLQVVFSGLDFVTFERKSKLYNRKCSERQTIWNFQQQTELYSDREKWFLAYTIEMDNRVSVWIFNKIY